MTAYYNEIDPKAAAWLRELIKRGLIADGDVDETDIRDVDPARLGGYAQCHFFAGIGGWSLGLRLAGWPDDRPVWTGSCPCQPFSAAGRRAGVADERHLWPHWHHLISQCQPPVVFGEQVASKDGLGWLDLVHADMEATGYAFGAADLCAAGIGAPHIRQRLWFVGERLADAASGGCQSGPGIAGVSAGQVRHVTVSSGGIDGSNGGLADADGQHIQRGPRQGDGASSAAEREAWQRQRGGDDHRAGRSDGGLADASGLGRGAQRIGDHGGDERRQPDADGQDGGLADASVFRRGKGVEDIGRMRGRDGEERALGRSSVNGDLGGIRLADADSAGRIARQWHDQAAGHGHPSAAASGDGGLADADDAGSQGHGGSRGVDVSAGRPTEGRHGAEGGVDGGPRPTNGHWGTADWLFCRDGKWRPVEPASQRMANGLFLCLGSMRRTCVDEEEEALNAEEAVRLGRKALRVLREFNGPEAFWLSVGGRIGFPQATVLLAVVRKYARELGVFLNSEATGGEQDVQAFLQALRECASQTPCPPQGSESSEQLIGELGDALSKLSQDSAQYRELVISLASYTAGPLAQGTNNRVGRLRGYGNAIVPQVAATFIRSVM